MSTIATTVYDVETISLADGTELELRPLPIGRMRLFMKEFGKLSSIKEDDEAFDIFVDMTLIILNALSKEKKWSKETVEDEVDLETMKYMFRVSGGIDMDAPKEIAETLSQREGVGTL